MTAGKQRELARYQTTGDGSSASWAGAGADRVTGRLEPVQFAGALAYEHCDVPPQMTLAAWRAQRHDARRRTRRRRWPRRVLQQMRRVRRSAPGEARWPPRVVTTADRCRALRGETAP